MEISITKIAKIYQINKRKVYEIAINSFGEKYIYEKPKTKANKRYYIVTDNFVKILNFLFQIENFHSKQSIRIYQDFIKDFVNHSYDKENILILMNALRGCNHYKNVYGEIPHFSKNQYYKRKNTILLFLSSIISKLDYVNNFNITLNVRHSKGKDEIFYKISFNIDDYQYNFHQIAKSSNELFKEFIKEEDSIEAFENKTHSISQEAIDNIDKNLTIINIAYHIIRILNNNNNEY